MLMRSLAVVCWVCGVVFAGGAVEVAVVRGWAAWMGVGLLCVLAAAVALLGGFAWCVPKIFCDE